MFITMNTKNTARPCFHGQRGTMPSLPSKATWFNFFQFFFLNKTIVRLKGELAQTIRSASVLSGPEKLRLEPSEPTTFRYEDI